jgi:ABC-type polysaccharide/polyol phosphate transport system ATPase subunit
MSSERPVVELREVSLRYRLAKQKLPSLKEYAIHWMKGALSYEDLWALREVSLALGRGESLGIVGRNGAGKSTLLKVISRVLKPTRGTVRVQGAVAPILELGTGFDHELTGHENIYLNALLLGRTRKEIDGKLDAIVEFSGLEEFIRSPVRNYSSGMLARLGFAIATAWEPDVLILDEVLSVGDARFLRRCERRMEEFRERGTTILLVSHDVEAVRENCRRAVWLEKGRIEASGSADEVIDRYVAFSESG